MWSVGSILMGAHSLTHTTYHSCLMQPLGLLSFMLEDTVTSGSITTTRDQKVKLAQYSRKFNRSNRVFAVRAAPLTSVVYRHAHDRCT